MAEIIPIVEPRREISWETFVSSAEPFSIAFDGYVSDLTRFDLNRHLANFNHHKDCNRHITSATCGMFMYYIKNMFEEDFIGHAKQLYVCFNDPDQDSSLCYWLAHNMERVRKGEPLVHKLVNVENELDKSGGIWTQGLNSRVIKENTWIFEPYTSQRHRMKLVDASEMLSIMQAIYYRINEYTLGQGKLIEPNADREDLFKEGKIIMYKEIGPWAKTKLFEEGYGLGIRYAGLNKSGNHCYSAGKLRPFFPIDTVKIADYFNQLEGLTNSSDCWGGGDNFVCSPREAGTKISPEDFFKEIVRFGKKA